MDENITLRALGELLSTVQRIMSNDEEPAEPQQQLELSNIMRCVQETNLKIYQMVLNMQTSLPPQVERQQPVYFLDACGFRAPFHLEFIKSWEAFTAVLNINFKSRGLQLVERNHYVIEDAHNGRVLDATMPWESCFFPGQQVNMDALFNEDKSGNSCPVCHHAETADTDQAIDW